MRRRAALAALVASALPGAVFAAPRDRVWCIGYLSGGSNRPDDLVKPLADLGYVEGRNLRYEVRVVDMRNPEKLKADAASLVSASPDVLIAWQSDRVSALARATANIPIVACLTADPIGQGLAESLRRPGRNVTGMTAGVRETAEILVSLLRAVRPRLKRIAFLHRPMDPAAPSPWEMVAGWLREAGRRLDVSVSLHPVASEADAQRAFMAVGEPEAAAAILGPQIAVEGDVLEAMAIRRRIALVGNPAAGALMFYSMDYADGGYPRIAAIIDKILRGQKPGDIPFEQPDRSSFVINRATARSIGVTIPNDLLLRATEVIG